MSGKVAVSAYIKAKPGQKQRLVDIFVVLQRETLAHEAGCLSYALCRAHDDPGQLVFYETWASQAALDAHIDAPHTKTWFAQTRDVSVEPSAITKLELIADLSR